MLIILNLILQQKFPQASYPHTTEGRQNKNHNQRQLTKLITWTTALSNSMKLGHAHGAIPWGGPWWRDLTECGPLEKGMANHFSRYTYIPSLLKLPPISCPIPPL